MQISTQGLIRLTFEALSDIPLRHLMSGVDTDGSVETCGSPTELTGFTEWVTYTSPGITIGWDWKIESRDGQSRYERLGLPRTNIMLINGHGQDHGWDQTLSHLGQYVDALPWSSKVDETIKFINIA